MNLPLPVYQCLFMDQPENYRAALLSDHQIALVRRVSKYQNSVYAREIASEFGISIQSASVQLRTLWEKKYLTRIEKISPTGGKEFAYSSQYWGLK